ncbi:hypothetical protein [Phormidium tenue]|uniref:Uncharacterized protein n=1 Tax=Phormidium tenue NIES-30 TaxID=549789 RepID=A0A1U7J2T1_9CYAN|nr:hypothetical protein [Phormidium tenue]MBD2233274.1 hypothetical protein [Phormidium tenue FACHB-1052]OKH46556.1 hypothetical protein NIES30_15745 [Phormidium tenue NIES-30]
MLKALQQTVRVGAGGKIELVAPECPEGVDVQVIVLLAPQSEPIASLPAQVLAVDEAESAGQSTIAKIQAMVRRYVPEGRSLVDELIADRRAEAERE